MTLKDGRVINVREGGGGRERKCACSEKTETVAAAAAPPGWTHRAELEFTKGDRGEALSPVRWSEVDVERGYNPAARDSEKIGGSGWI